MRAGPLIFNWKPRKEHAVEEIDAPRFVEPEPDEEEPSNHRGTTSPESILRNVFSRALGGERNPQDLAAKIIDDLQKEGWSFSGNEEEARDMLAGFLYEARHRVGAFSGVTNDQDFSQAIEHVAEKIRIRGKTKAKPQPQSRHFCFLSETKVLMANGTEKPIEYIRNNDLILTALENTKKQAAGRVQEVYRAHSSEYYVISPVALKVTDSHPLYTRKRDGRQGWAVINPELAAQKNSLALETGDALFTKDGIWIPVTSLERVAEEVTVFNVKRVLPHRTFFANGVLAHNGIMKG